MNRTPMRGSAFERAGLATLAAQLLTDAAGATCRARDLLDLADLAGAGAVPAALTRALADLAESRCVVDARLDALRATLRGDHAAAALAHLDAGAALDQLQRRAVGDE